MKERVPCWLLHREPPDAERGRAGTGEHGSGALHPSNCQDAAETPVTAKGIVRFPKRGSGVPE